VSLTERATTDFKEWSETIQSKTKWSRRNLLRTQLRRFRVRDGVRLCLPETLARTRFDPPMRELFRHWIWRSRTRTGVEVALRPFTADLHILHEIWDFHVYDPPAIQSIRPRIILDVGAHIGLYSLYAATAFHPERIIAVEPEPGNFQLLVRNLQLNNLRNVVAIEAALVGHTREVSLFQSMSNSGGHSIVRESGHSIMVRGLSTHDLFEAVAVDRVDFMKMDCEGAEFEILLNTPEASIERISQMVFEYNLDAYGPEGLQRIITRLMGCGLVVEVLPSSQYEGIVFAYR